MTNQNQGFELTKFISFIILFIKKKKCHISDTFTVDVKSECLCIRQQNIDSLHDTVHLAQQELLMHVR